MVRGSPGRYSSSCTQSTAHGIAPALTPMVEEGTWLRVLIRQESARGGMRMRVVL